jgi:hypothetical protein
MENSFKFRKLLKAPLWSDIKHKQCNWRTLCLVIFVSLLIILPINVIVLMPAAILWLANSQAQHGQMIGDPSGIPGYMLPVAIITLILTVAIEVYLLLVVLVNVYDRIVARRKKTDF